MKDKQVQSAGPLPGIPIISPILHVISMTGLVFLRTSFGYSFLSPKSIFLALIWATGLFYYYATHELGAWPKWWGVASFAVIASALYLVHLGAAFVRELRRTGQHDHYSGKPHLMRLAWMFGPSNRSRLETAIQLWLEPLAAFIAAGLASSAGIPKLPGWITLVACSLWAKEAINYWYRLRQQKKQADIFTDAQESIEAGSNSAESSPGAGGRKLRERRPRAL